MVLQTEGGERFEIGIEAWHAALETAEAYGWDRASREAQFGGSDNRPDHFRYPWGQKIGGDHMLALAGCLQEAADAGKGETELPALIHFLRQVKPGREVTLTL